MLVIPHLVDQFYWGQRVYELGVGPHPIRRTKLDANRLATALDELVHNAKYRSAATVLGEQIRLENGVDHAVRLIEETFGNELLP